ncbi:MAG: flagellar hook basal-body protein [Dissulfurispiraceae bacterium]|jgi:flagellar basal body rod protein FlgG|nr:flagellar hook basal-body protein [Dissulfurispiraceae bacterium]
MYKGAYVALTGAIIRGHEMDNVANNLSNVNTTGYKRSSFGANMYSIMQDIDTPAAAEYPDARAMAYFGDFKIDQTQGTVKTTGNVFDIAISGEGYFAVQDNNGTYYTRNGVFTIDRNGLLMNESGQRVLNTAGNQIVIPREDPSAQINIGKDGSIYAGANLVGKVKVVKLTDIEHLGGSLYKGNESGLSKADLLQGTIEQSNVNGVREMIGMIVASRNLESSIKLIKSFDDLSQRVVNELAKIR